MNEYCKLGPEIKKKKHKTLQESKTIQPSSPALSQKKQKPKTKNPFTIHCYHVEYCLTDANKLLFKLIWAPYV